MVNLFVIYLISIICIFMVVACEVYLTHYSFHGYVWVTSTGMHYGLLGTWRHV
jgi:hypothetical protein